MRCEDLGIGSGSEMFIDTPSDIAKDMLYYATSCGHFFTEYNYQIRRENFHNYMLFYIVNGRLSVTNEGNTMVADKGKVGFLNCHKPHEYHTIRNTEFLWVHLDGENTEKFYRRVIGQYNGFVFSHVHADNLRTLIQQLLNSYQTGQRLHEAEKSQLLYSMLTCLLYGSTSRDAGEKEAPVLKAALQFMEANLSRQITLQDIAGEVNVSLYHFARLFKKAYGYSPYEYVLLARINRAKHLLRTTDEPIKVIAQRVGYVNASTFSSVFTAKVGLSPTAFRSYPI